MANALEQFITNVQNLSASGSFAKLADLCRRAVHDTLIKNAQHLDNALSTLDLQSHSMGILTILTAKLMVTSSSSANFESLLAQITEFINCCNGEQIRCVPDLYCELCHRLTERLLKNKTPMKGISLISKAVERLQSNPNQLTSAHSDLCLLCLQSRVFKPALLFLDSDVMDILKETVNGVFDSRYFLLYFYYGGMIYGALKNFERALYFFESAVSTPCTAVSAIMVEAYKKYILIGLIHKGKILPLPKYTSTVVNRFIKPMCQVYVDLAQAYCSTTLDNLHEAMNKNQLHFANDQNMGLVKQVVKSRNKRNILRLTKTFLTLSLTDVANRCKLPHAEEAEKYILTMIDEGDIFATINQKDGMVYFQDNPEKYCSPEIMENIEDQLQGCMDLDGLIRKRDTELYLNPQYVNKVTKGSSGGGGGMSSAFSALHEDEGVSVGSGSTPKELSDLLGMA